MRLINQLQDSAAIVRSKDASVDFSEQVNGGLQTNNHEVEGDLLQLTAKHPKQYHHDFYEDMRANA